MRFLHSADLHIDRSFEGVHLLSEKVKTQLPAINQKIIRNLVDVALEKAVDFVLLAGDTFHQARPSLKVQHDFFAQLQRLGEAQIPVYMIFGNHDYYDPQRYWFAFPENVILFSSEEVQTVQGTTKNDETYAISGFSYQHPWIAENKVTEFPARAAVDYHIGLYHGDQAGERYAPFSISEMKKKGYDYWGLGHIHVPKTLLEQPPILYPGTPQGKTKKEQATGVILADLTPQGPTIERLEVAEIAWQKQVVSLADVTASNAVLPAIIERLKSPRSRLLHLVLTDVQQLPPDWFPAAEKNEWLTYLNERLAQTEPLQVIYALEVEQANEDKIALAVSEDYMLQFLAMYESPEMFADRLSDLLQHPLIQRGITHESFQEEVLQQAKQLLKDDFQWEEQS
ncbi:phosphoesterase [Enterococcus innesii]|uniref:Phosphoesterase n=1 Tax=Enterococcus innesii TaxID=2839759 RepID=A0ABM7XS77_9ENTE|nr:DNA repair exonuclease [Enterococcus innesii]BDG67928.1 phosphoesterase [Enterococcus innesii]